MIRSILCCAVASHASAQHLAFEDGTAASGLGGISATRVRFADLNADGTPDAIISDASAHRVFLGMRGGEPGSVPRFEEVSGTGLPGIAPGDCVVFARINDDEFPDAIFTRSLDIHNPKFVPPPEPAHACWFRGNGDGTFAAHELIPGATRGTTSSIAVGDVDLDGLPDLFLGTWYTRYGESNEAFGNDLLFQRREGDRVTWERATLPSDGVAFTETSDAGGRPCYGVMILPPSKPASDRPWLFELCYGRRANRAWVRDIGQKSWRDAAPGIGLDADADRSGVYPDWLAERAKTDARFNRAPEKPYRTGGNTFDGAMGDVNNDGKLDVFVSEITHAWAGSSSDRSRFLINDGATFRYEPVRTVDRIPADPTIRSWNQGDMFADLADFDHDGRLDLLLSSGDYPDDQRLRLYRQQESGRFVDISASVGIIHDGSQMFSLADVDGDSDLDILVGQSFHRLAEAQVAGRTPRVKLLLDRMIERRTAAGLRANAVTIRLAGAERKGVSQDALGALASLRTLSGTQTHALIGIGGCSGKQHEFLLHFGLGENPEGGRLVVYWPDAARSTSMLEGVKPGFHTIRRDSP